MATTVYSTNMRPLSSVIRSLPLINPDPFRVGVYQWQTSSELGLGLYICQKNLLAMASTLHTYIHIHIRTYPHVHTHTRTYVHIQAQGYSYTHVQGYSYTYTYMHTHAHTHVHTHSIQHCIACSKHTGLSCCII